MSAFEFEKLLPRDYQLNEVEDEVEEDIDVPYKMNLF